MPNEVVVALITAIAGIIGGVVGAIASPVGKDWVNKRQFEREAAKADADRDREAATLEVQRAQESHQQLVRDRNAQVDGTRELVGEAMQHYDAEWRGIATYHAKTESLRAGNQAWIRAQSLADTELDRLIHDWKNHLDRADMQYRSGIQPPGHDDLQDLYRAVVARLGAIQQT